MPAPCTPTDDFLREYVEAVVWDYLGQKIESAERFPIGLSHYVFDVSTESEDRFVVRVARPSRRPELEGGLYWRRELERIGVPLPGVITAGELGGYPFAIHERLPGTDLEEIYPTLSEQNKKEIAYCVADIQKKVHTLPGASGYGHSVSYDDPRLKKYQTWPDVLHSIMDRTERELLNAGLCDVRYVDLVRARIRQYEDYLATVSPTAFLYDTNIRNVIVDGGVVRGIIDVDEVTFGDPLLTIGFAKTYLLLARHDTHFTAHWCDYLNCSAFQMRMIDLYALLYSVRFMATLGQELNGNPSRIVNPDNASRLEQIADRLLGTLS